MVEMAGRTGGYSRMKTLAVKREEVSPRQDPTIGKKRANLFDATAT